MQGPMGQSSVSGGLEVGVGGTPEWSKVCRVGHYCMGLSWWPGRPGLARVACYAVTGIRNISCGLVIVTSIG